MSKPTKPTTFIKFLKDVELVSADTGTLLSFDKGERLQLQDAWVLPPPRTDMVNVVFIDGDVSIVAVQDVEIAREPFPGPPGIRIYAFMAFEDGNPPEDYVFSHSLVQLVAILEHRVAHAKPDDSRETPHPSGLSYAGRLNKAYISAIKSEFPDLHRYDYEPGVYPLKYPADSEEQWAISPWPPIGLIIFEDRIPTEAPR